ncbi:KICSTOR complex protein ITFG2 [Rhipicephalus sanguineus]|uniref:KICSTOR complex protein ITFG2 n=1 Tax=Rhipicephalus sanguineus TaxID=34632 RepID=UPI0018935BC7|nr:KICSTOR complex protein ITFG2 [Rhipicephalus sanguineus]XP_037507966.1 KICSTOR complex protein ITFG2 [Rhipicephalus sanguineus]
MRAVSFLDKVEYEFVGNFMQHAICLGDVDNDKNVELVAGNLQGELAVFKFQQPRPWALASNLGAVAAVIVGDILNDSQNKVLSISGDGWCHMFALQADTNEDDRKQLQPFHSQRLPANTKMALLADINKDGKMELILGLTDRVVRTYQWSSLSESGTESQGKLVGLHKWEFANQVGNISLNNTPEGGLAILVAQPGGTYIKLDFGTSKASPAHDSSPGETAASNGVATEDSALLMSVSPQHHKLGLSHMRNPNVSSVIVGSILGTTRAGEPVSSLMALATLDGTLMLVDDGDNILWSLQVDHQLFALTKMDVVGDGREEVIACAWDGQTYIVNEERQSVRFQFDEAVCTFTAGNMSLSSGETQPCLVYATFNNRIVVYYNITFTNMATQSLLDDAQLVAAVNALVPDVDPRKFLQWCLYGSRPLLGDQASSRASEHPVEGTDSDGGTEEAE